MTLTEREQILRAIFSITDTMDESEKNYILGYIKGFEDRKKQLKGD